MTKIGEGVGNGTAAVFDIGAAAEAVVEGTGTEATQGVPGGNFNFPAGNTATPDVPLIRMGPACCEALHWALGERDKLPLAV
jgi:hypothetical protein